LLTIRSRHFATELHQRPVTHTDSRFTIRASTARSLHDSLREIRGSRIAVASIAPSATQHAVVSKDTINIVHNATHATRIISPGTFANAGQRKSGGANNVCYSPVSC